MKVQALELLPVFNGGDAFVRDVFGEVEVEIGNAAEVLELLHAAIGDVSERKIENAQLGILVQTAEVRVFHPGSAQIDAGDAALSIASDRPAEVTDPLSIFF